MNEPIVNGAPYRTPAKRFGHDHLEAAIVEARAAATSLRKHAEAHPSALGVAHAYAAATRHIERLLGSTPRSSAPENLPLSLRR